MNKKRDPHHTSDGDRDVAESVKADDPKRSMSRLARLTSRIVKTSKETVDQLREGSGVT